MDSAKRNNEGEFWSEKTNLAAESMPAASQDVSLEQDSAFGNPWHDQSQEEVMPEVTSLNDAWKDKVPNDFIQYRDTIDGINILYVVCTALYLLMALIDSDTIPLPLPFQFGPLMILGIAGILHFVVSRQTRQARWHQNEMTLVLYRHVIFGKESDFVEYAVQLESQDRLELKSETRVEYCYDMDGDPTSHRITTYWVERFRGELKMEFSTQDWKSKKNLNRLIDFVHSKLQQ